jgi:hypothetical protein
MNPDLNRILGQYSRASQQAERRANPNSVPPKPLWTKARRGCICCDDMPLPVQAAGYVAVYAGVSLLALTVASPWLRRVGIGAQALNTAQLLLACVALLGGLGYAYGGVILVRAQSEERA